MWLCLFAGECPGFYSGPVLGAPVSLSPCVLRSPEKYALRSCLQMRGRRLQGRLRSQLPTPPFPNPGSKPLLHPFVFPTEAPLTNVTLPKWRAQGSPDIRASLSQDQDKHVSSMQTSLCHVCTHCPSLKTHMLFFSCLYP